MNYTQQGCSATCCTSNLKFISNLEIVSITVIFLPIYGLFFTSQPMLKSIHKDFLLCHHVISNVTVMLNILAEIINQKLVAKNDQHIPIEIHHRQ